MVADYRGAVMDQKAANLAAVEASERLAEILIKIQRDVAAPELADVAWKLNAKLEGRGALTVKHGRLLDGASQDVAQAGEARAEGRVLDAQAAMMRAYTTVNAVAMEVLERCPKAGF
jgi:hypothetical protein